VLTASDPLQGLQVYETHWRAIQLVLLDYFMPTLRGDEVFERLQRINPHVRVLLTTACDDYVSPKMLQGGLCGFVQKPLSRQDLIGEIRKSLNHHDALRPHTKRRRLKSIRTLDTHIEPSTVAAA
jgi:response regulator RpfG family c-di-GMP phosphodiesterase